MAHGSLYELDSHLQIAADLNYLTVDKHEKAIKMITEVGKLLGAFI